MIFFFQSSHVFFFAKDGRTVTSEGRKGAPHFRRFFGRELVSKPAISSRKNLGGGATVERLGHDRKHIQIVKIVIIFSANLGSRRARRSKKKKRQKWCTLLW